MELPNRELSFEAGLIQDRNSLEKKHRPRSIPNVRAKIKSLLSLLSSDIATHMSRADAVDDHPSKPHSRSHSTALANFLTSKL